MFAEAFRPSLYCGWPYLGVSGYVKTLGPFFLLELGISGVTEVLDPSWYCGWLDLRVSGFVKALGPPYSYRWRPITTK